jgi:hypothetical protein
LAALRTNRGEGVEGVAHDCGVRGFKGLKLLSSGTRAWRFFFLGDDGQVGRPCGRLKSGKKRKASSGRS